MEPDNLTLRPYGVAVGDWQMVSGWHEARHDGQILFETLIPPCGIICEDSSGPAAAIFAYEANGIGVAHCDTFLTRPGITFAQARRVGAFALGGLRLCLRRRHYGLIKVFTPCRAMQRVLKNLGFAGENGVLLLAV